MYNSLINRKSKVSVIGLGYVGMPIAVAFAKKVDVIGLILTKRRLNNIKLELIQQMKLVMMRLRELL